ncbi:MAG: hypothetical protein C0501_19500 [Isosphaera sp.]|nr:hypothetical protein [Isosphaera sp.]
MFTAPVLLVLAAAPGDTYPLQWKLKAGDTFYNKTTVDMDQSIEVMGQKIPQKVTVKTVVRFKVKSADPKATVVEMTYLENKIDAQGLPGANVGDKLNNITFTATLNDKMEVTKLEGYDKFVEALADGDEAQKALMKAMMPESAIRQAFSQTFVVGPGKPVAVGETWTRTDKVGLGPLGNVETKSEFKLTGVKGDAAAIAVKGDLTFKAGDGGDAGLPFKITKADLKADKFSGTHTFDLKAGRVAESKVEMAMSGTMTIEAAGQKIDAKLSQKMSTTSVVTDKNPIKD